MKTIYRIIDTIRNVIVISLFGFIIIVGAVQIFLRYTPGFDALIWVDEIMRYLNIWLIFLASSIAVKYNSHLKLDYFICKTCSEYSLPIVRRITHIVIIVSLIIVIVFGTQRTIANLNAVIQSLPISIAFFYAAIPIGSCFILLDYILILIYGEHPYARLGETEE
jgi:C4-dicarboxylate transporter DctQ subunit